MKHQISKNQMVSEFEETGKVTILSYENDRRVLTYASATMNTAFREILQQLSAGGKLIILDADKGNGIDMIKDYAEAFAAAKQADAIKRLPWSFGDRGRS